MAIKKTLIDKVYLVKGEELEMRTPAGSRHSIKAKEDGDYEVYRLEERDEWVDVSSKCKVEIIGHNTFKVLMKND